MTNEEFCKMCKTPIDLDDGLEGVCLDCSIRIEQNEIDHWETRMAECKAHIDWGLNEIKRLESGYFKKNK